MRKHLTKFNILLLSLMLLVGGMIGGSQLLPQPAVAGPEIVGNPEGATSRVLFQQAGVVKRITYVDRGVKTMANTTPVSSDPVCGTGAEDLYVAEIVLAGTMTGTAPTLAFKWQNSYDGTTWTDVGTWTTVNATVTPATQKQTVADIRNASTAVAFGPCWRSQYTFGGTGTVTADFSIKGYQE